MRYRSTTLKNCIQYHTSPSTSIDTNNQLQWALTAVWPYPGHFPGKFKLTAISFVVWV